MPPTLPVSRLTRREALVLGAATAAAATAQVSSASAASPLVGSGSEGPGYLRRSTYTPLVGEDFTVGPHVVRLTAVRDVLGAAADASLRGHEDAFALEFTGAAGAFTEDIHLVSHPLVGPFPLFVGPTGRVTRARQAYGATIDRSVRVNVAAAPHSATAPDAGRRRDAHEARVKLRDAYAERVRFKSEQRARMRRTRAGWLLRHGR
jgi:hypothetical protein